LGSVAIAQSSCHRTGQASLSQPVGRANGFASFLFGNPAQAIGVVAVVARPGVRHHAQQPNAAVVQGATDLQQHLAFGLNARAVAVDVDLDQDLEGFTVRLAEVHDRVCAGKAVSDDLQRGALAAQGQRLRQLSGLHADCVRSMLACMRAVSITADGVCTVESVVRPEAAGNAFGLFIPELCPGLSLTRLRRVGGG
jgi:hypothetical protein